MAKKAKTETAISTEEKIKDAARTVFSSKGYAATRTRDIAEEAGINLALLNYYFRSKEKLFEIVMTEKMEKYFGVLAPVLNDEATTLHNKVESIAGNYIDLIIENPELPLFVLSELRNNPEHFTRITEKAGSLQHSVFIRQIQEKRPDLNPFHLMVSILGMCLFPFLMKPVLLQVTNLKEKAFNEMMLERKQLIPVWTKAMLKAK